MRAIFQNGGQHINVKAFSIDLPFSLEADLQSDTLGNAANLFINSVVMPYV
jgi:hypothetical protein